jgi:DNA polymerase III epsilon subunit-like protein
MAYVAWDTETTGLPVGYPVASQKNVHLFDISRLLSIAYVKYDAEGNEVDSDHMIVYPDDFIVDAVHIHGSTPEHAKEHGLPFEEVYNRFLDSIKDCDTLVAHNSKFDESILMSECYRRGFSVEPFKNFKFVCTHKMTLSTFLKPMKLGYLYADLTGKELENAHNALADSRACGEVYHILRNYKRVLKPLGIKKIKLKASEVASMIDKNRYCKPEDIVMNLWCKYSPDTFEGQTKEQIAIEAINSSNVASELLADAQKFVSKDSTAVEQKYRAVSNQLISKTNLSDKQKDAAKDYIRKTLYTNHGTRHESTTAKLNPDYIEDDTYYKYTVCVIEGTEYEIVGRIDRLIKDEMGSLTLVEIKNRANCLFKNVREYEEIQCQTYMEMLNIESCRLVEQHNKDTCTHLLKRDKDGWQTDILPKLKNFCEHFHSQLSK